MIPWAAQVFWIQHLFILKWPKLWVFFGGYLHCFSASSCLTGSRNQKHVQAAFASIRCDLQLAAADDAEVGGGVAFNLGRGSESPLRSIIVFPTTEHCVGRRQFNSHALLSSKYPNYWPDLPGGNKKAGRGRIKREVSKPIWSSFINIKNQLPIRMMILMMLMKMTKSNLFWGIYPYLRDNTDRQRTCCSRKQNTQLSKKRAPCT